MNEASLTNSCHTRWNVFISSLKLFLQRKIGVSVHAKQNKYITFILSPAEDLTKSAEYIRQFLPFDLFPEV
jgi:hypothetical protein